MENEKAYRMDLRLNMRSSRRMIAMTCRMLLLPFNFVRIDAPSRYLNEHILQVCMADGGLIIEAGNMAGRFFPCFKKTDSVPVG